MSWHVDFAKPSRKGLSKRDQIARYRDMTVQHHHTDHTISLFIDLPFCMKPGETWHKFANLWSIWPWHQGLGSLRTWIHSSASKLASDYRSIIDLYSIMIYWQIVTFVYICNSFAYMCGLFPNFANQINHTQGIWDHLLKSTSTSCNDAWNSWLVSSRACGVGRAR